MGIPLHLIFPSIPQCPDADELASLHTEDPGPTLAAPSSFVTALQEHRRRIQSQINGQQGNTLTFAPARMRVYIRRARAGQSFEEPCPGQEPSTNGQGFVNIGNLASGSINLSPASILEQPSTFRRSISQWTIRPMIQTIDSANDGDGC